MGGILKKISWLADISLAGLSWCFGITQLAVSSERNIVPEMGPGFPELIK
jgi:hypothetical protein